jgi:hypothetical protein
MVDTVKFFGLFYWVQRPVSVSQNSVTERMELTSEGILLV